MGEVSSLKAIKSIPRVGGDTVDIGAAVIPNPVLSSILQWLEYRLRDFVCCLGARAEIGVGAAPVIGREWDQ
jgi:hypothetical protein